MKTGLLWFDDDPRKELEEKVLRAAAHYERKYGQAPNLCFVHPSAFNGNGNRKRGKKGVFRATLELEPGREYPFRYLINGEHWHNDRRADAYVPSGLGEDNCVVVTPKADAA